MQETEFVKKLQCRDEAAFKQLVHTYKNMVYNTILGFVQNVEEAEDLAQEVFIQVYQTINSFNGNSKISTWLHRICINKCIDFERSRKAKKRFNGLKRILGISNNEEFDVTDFHHPGVALHNKETACILFKAVNKLPLNQKEAFILIKIEKLSYSEVAEILQTTTKAIEGLVHRANINLRQQLVSYYESIK